MAKSATSTATRRHNQTDPLPALGAKPHESSASGGYLGNAFKGSKASMRRSIGTTDTRRSEPRAPRREPAGLALPLPRYPTPPIPPAMPPLFGPSRYVYPEPSF